MMRKEEILQVLRALDVLKKNLHKVREGEGFVYKIQNEDGYWLNIISEKNYPILKNIEEGLLDRMWNDCI